MRRTLARSPILGILLGLGILGAGADLATAQAPPLKVFLVRHAEPQPGNDPALSAAGRQRAGALATALRGAGITAIFTSPLLRTRETAAPLAAALGLAPTPIGLARGIDAHVTALANAIRGHSGGAVLVVGHSNTVPRLIGLLGGPTLQNLCETSFDILFSVALEGGEAMLTPSRYGAASPPPGPDCM